MTTPAQAMLEKGAKFGNIRTVVDGHTFDSKLEARCYAELKLREKAGEITGLKLQVTFPLAIGDAVICRYRADFTFFTVADQRFRVLDAKGKVTPEFRIKAKLFEAIHGYPITLWPPPKPPNRAAKKKGAK